MEVLHLPNLSLPQHVTLPPTALLRVLFPAVTIAPAVLTNVSRAIKHACWSPTEIHTTWRTV
jgi:hypothetical protein